MTDALLLAGAFLLGFLVCAGLSTVLLRELVSLHREERDLHVSERDQFRSERRELLNRVQHPNLVPTGTERPVPRAPDPQIAQRVREWASVGRVTNGGDSSADPPTVELPELP